MDDKYVICYTSLHNDVLKEIKCKRINRKEIGLELNPCKLQVSEYDDRILFCFEGQLISAGLGKYASVLYSEFMRPIRCSLDVAYTRKESIEPNPQYRIEGNDVLQNMRRIYILAHQNSSFVCMKFDDNTLRPILIQVEVGDNGVIINRLNQ